MTRYKILHSESKQSDMTTLWPNDMWRSIIMNSKQGKSDCWIPYVIPWYMWPLKRDKWFIHVGHFSTESVHGNSRKQFSIFRRVYTGCTWCHENVVLILFKFLLCCIQRKQKCAFTLPANTCYCRIMEAKVNKSKGTGLLGRSNEGAIEVSILTGCP